MECHKCGACCEFMSISSYIPGHRENKPVGVKCMHLDGNNLCRLFDDPLRPDICSAFQPVPELCGTNRKEAVRLITAAELLTKPEAR